MKNKKNRLSKWLSRGWWAGLSVIVMIMIFVIEQWRNSTTSQKEQPYQAIPNEVVKKDSSNIDIADEETESNKKEKKQSPKMITIIETGTGSHYYKDKAIELAKVNAFNNLKSNYGLADIQILSRRVLEIKIDSLRNNIRATVEVEYKYKKVK